MTEVKLYESFDGKLFENPKICKAYEEAMKENSNDPGIQFFNINGIELDQCDASMACSYIVSDKRIADAILHEVQIEYISNEDFGDTDPGKYEFDFKTYKWIKEE